MAISLVLLVDKIFFDSSLQQRPLFEGVGRMTWVLAHEIYGRVQHFLTLDIKSATEFKASNRADLEHQSFLKAVEFLDKLVKNEKFSSLPRPLQEALLNIQKEKTCARLVSSPPARKDKKQLH